MDQISPLAETQRPARSGFVPDFELYGEETEFPDVLHCELLKDRAPAHGWRITPHRHGRLHQFFLIVAGEGRCHLDGETCELGQGSVLNVPAGAVHSFSFEPGIKGYVLTIPVFELADARERLPLGSSALAGFFKASADRGVVDMFREIHSEFTGHRQLRAPMLRAMSRQIACVVARLAPTEAGLTLGAGSDPRIQRFEQLVRNEDTRGWRVSDYAREVGLSPNHLIRLCRAHLGVSPQRFIEDVAFREARRMLAYTRMSIAEVGFSVGFEDPSYFSRAFRKRTGVTPKAYRETLAS